MTDLTLPGNWHDTGTLLSTHPLLWFLVKSFFFPHLSLKTRLNVSLPLSLLHLLHTAVCVFLPDKTLNLYRVSALQTDLPHYLCQRRQCTAGWILLCGNTLETSGKAKAGQVESDPAVSLGSGCCVFLSRPPDSDCIICSVIKEPGPDLAGYYLGDSTVTFSPSLPLFLSFHPYAA